MMTSGDKAMLAFRVVMAFQHFAGKSLRCLDSVEKLGEKNLQELEALLIQVAQNLRREDEAQFPDCHKLADQIEKQLPDPNAA